MDDAQTNYITANRVMRKQHRSIGAMRIHKLRIRSELRRAYVSRLALKSSESRYLPYIIRDDEHIQAAVFGYQEAGFVMLVATDKRVIFLDKKPLFINQDEVTFDVVSGVKLNETIIGTTLKLHTRVKDYKLFTFNEDSAEFFMNYIETHCLEFNNVLRNTYDRPS